MKVNVYLEPTERKKLEQIKQKYQVSLSTIAEKSAFYLIKYYYLSYPEDKELIFKTRIGDAKHKTSIKPKDNVVVKNEINAYGHSPNILYTNALKTYLNKDFSINIKKELRDKYFMEIDRDLQKTNEPNWNYNTFKRNYYRVLKENE